jgi:predicted amidohydrolase
MKIAYLQFKPEFCNPAANIEKIKTLTAEKEFDLLVIPELANSGYLFTEKKELEKTAEYFGEGRFYSVIKEISERKSSFIVTGFCEKEGEKFYNSSMLVCPDGKKYLYRKIHLFWDEYKWFTPGNLPFEAVDIEGSFGKVKIGMMICFDWAFPEAARTLAIAGAQIICHPSNLVMPYCQKAMYARAVENRVFIITCNRIGTEEKGEKKLTFTGNSVILDTAGNYLSAASVEKEQLNTVEINPDEALNKFINPVNNVITDRRPNLYK